MAGAGEGKIVALHLLPSFKSYLIVSLTLAVPDMILGVAALSFLGLRLSACGEQGHAAEGRPERARGDPWLIPGVLVVTAVLAFDFLGDGLRAAADPYK